MSGWDYLSSVRGVPAVFWFAVSAMVGIMVSMALTLAVRLLFGCLRSVHGPMQEFFFFLNEQSVVRTSGRGGKCEMLPRSD